MAQKTSQCTDPMLEGNLGIFANPLSDTAFKKIFGSEEYKEVTIGLINSFIPERKITDIEFSNVEMQGQTEAERPWRLISWSQDWKSSRRTKTRNTTAT